MPATPRIGKKAVRDRPNIPMSIRFGSAATGDRLQVNVRRQLSRSIVINPIVHRNHLRAFAKARRDEG